MAEAVRNLVWVLGDQLDPKSSALDGFDRDQDAVFMAEARVESTKVWCSKVRIAFFLSAMRHFARELERKNIRVVYHELAPGKDTSLSALLEQVVADLRPEKLILVQPGEHAVAADLEAQATRLAVPLELREDRHFMCTREKFANHAAGRKQLRMEYFYREMRRRSSLLMEGDQPAGGAWNFDTENRQAFEKHGPGALPAPKRFTPDACTREVIELVEREFPDHPGELDSFAWPVTRRQALAALKDFIQHRLPAFGAYQDAMWTDEAWLYHSLISAALNVKLLNPREVCAAAEQAWRDDPDRYPLNAVEGFIRQILGWREYVRGIYWHFMPEYLERNALEATADLPEFYWTGETDMHCLSQAIGQTLRHGYAHHIQRLMVTGLYALLAGVDPRQVHEWYLAVYVDAVEWVELPNTLGMSQYADGGIMASKPYVASGKYIQRMSNYCAGCRFDPAKRTGEDACPFTTLYWDFLDRHRALLISNHRMRMQLRNLDRIDDAEMQDIRDQAALLKCG